MAPLLKLNCIGDEAMSRVQGILKKTGMRVLVSFDSPDRDIAGL
jgi:hypothetical protein